MDPVSHGILNVTGRLCKSRGMLDLNLAIAHHVMIFGVFATLLAELIVLRDLARGYGEFG